jgi:hypothetical protein
MGQGIAVSEPDTHGRWHRTRKSLPEVNTLLTQAGVRADDLVVLAVEGWGNPDWNTGVNNIPAQSDGARFATTFTGDVLVSAGFISLTPDPVDSHTTGVLTITPPPTTALQDGTPPWQPWAYHPGHQPTNPNTPGENELSWDIAGTLDGLEEDSGSPLSTA